MKTNTVGAELFLQCRNIEGGKIGGILCDHSGGGACGLTCDGTAGDDPHDIPHGIGDRGTASRTDEIFDGAAIQGGKGDFIDGSAALPVGNHTDRIGEGDALFLIRKGIFSDDTAGHAQLGNGCHGDGKERGIVSARLHKVIQGGGMGGDDKFGDFACIKPCVAFVFKKRHLICFGFLLLGNIAEAVHVELIAGTAKRIVPGSEDISLSEGFGGSSRKEGDVAVSCGIYHAFDTVGTPARFVFDHHMGDTVMLFAHTDSIAAVEDIDTGIEKQPLGEDGEKLGVVLHLKALILFGALSDALQPVVRVAILSSVGYRQAEQFFGNTVGDLMPHAVAEGEIDGDNARRSKTAQHELALEEDGTLSLSRRSKSCRDACKAAAADCDIIG